MVTLCPCDVCVTFGEYSSTPGAAVRQAVLFTLARRRCSMGIFWPLASPFLHIFTAFLTALSSTPRTPLAVSLFEAEINTYRNNTKMCGFRRDCWNIIYYILPTSPLDCKIKWRQLKEGRLRPFSGFQLNLCFSLLCFSELLYEFWFSAPAFIDISDPGSRIRLPIRISST